MTKLSQNISNLVFRRNIPLKLETYVLNCEMLQVLVEIDGIKTVAAIAGLLNKPVGELINTFATLYQQKLIFLVKPNPAIATQPRPERVDPSYRTSSPGRAAASVTTSREHLIARQFSSPSNSILTNGQRRAAQRISTDPLPQSYGDRSDANETLKSSVGNLPINFSMGPEFKQTYGGTELFRIKNSRRKILPRGGPGKRRGSGILGRKSNQNLPENQTADRISLHHSQNATDYFERGLAFLRRHSYAEALRHFRLSLDLDPHNQLCRANIQRVQKILKGNPKLSPEIS